MLTTTKKARPKFPRDIFVACVCTSYVLFNIGSITSYLTNYLTAALQPTEHIDIPVELKPISSSSSSSSSSSPALTIITVTRDPPLLFWDTVHFLTHQTFQDFRWLLVNDYTTDPTSYQHLQRAAQSDPRISLLNNTFPPGLPNGRNLGLQLLLQKPTPYFAFLDDDDKFEHNAYEKCLWMLESCPTLAACGSFQQSIGESGNTLSRYGFHNESLFFFGDNNTLGGSEMLRTSVLSNTPCVLDPDLTGGMEDYEFFLCLASHQQWGGTVPEYLYMHRAKPESVRKQLWGNLFANRIPTLQKIKDRYSQLKASFPQPDVTATGDHEVATLQIPFSNRLRKGSSRKRILILSHLSPTTVDLNRALVQALLQQQQQHHVNVTLVFTDTDQLFLVDPFKLLTPDVFVLPFFLRLIDVPRFLSYLLTSRSITTILTLESPLARNLIPWMASQQQRHAPRQLFDVDAGCRPDGAGPKAFHRYLDGYFQLTEKSCRDPANGEIEEVVASLLAEPGRAKAKGSSLPMEWFDPKAILEGTKSRFVEYHDVQKMLIGRRRRFFGNKYRGKCGEERTAAISTLIDYLEGHKLCDSRLKAVVPRIQNQSLQQCGRMCIMNLTDTSGKSGWFVNTTCQGLTPFKSFTHPCVANSKKKATKL